MPTGRILDQEGKVTPGTAEVLGKESDVHIAKVAWLSKKDTGKAYGSMVVYLIGGGGNILATVGKCGRAVSVLSPAKSVESG
jgi:hypothetical protein